MLRMVPLPRFAGANKQKHSRDAFRARVLQTATRRVGWPRSGVTHRCCVVGFASLSTTLRSTTTKKGKRNADKRVILPSASSDAARAEAQRARLSAFHHGSCQGAFAPFAQLQARLPGTRRKRIVLSSSPQPGGERLRAAKRALPAPACPSPGNAPPGPVVMPVSMMPEAARERTVSFRPRAPHSLRIGEYPRPKASVDERDFYFVTGMETNVK